MDTPPSGRSPSLRVTHPEVAMGGHLSRTNRAGLRPSIDPGIWMSVKTIGISARASRMATSFDHLEARASDHLRPAGPEQRFVFDDENDRPPDC
ncbi:hypothetical protein ABID60_008074 [Bradyrhizobium sp. S3.5.5]